MKRKGSVQINLIILAVLLIGGIIFGLFKFGVIEKDLAEEDEKPMIIQPVETDDEDKVEYDIAVGKEAPNFTLKNLDGEEVSLEDYRGKIVLLNFWATWCGYCDKEMPDMQKLSKENDDVVVLGVDVMEEKEIVEDYIEKGGYDFEVVLDEKGDVARRYLVQYFPTSYFIDKDGIMVGWKTGMLTGPEMNEAVKKIRKGE